MAKQNKLNISILAIMLLSLLNISFVFSSTNVLDIQLTEQVFENTSFSNIGGETINSYLINGEIIITNMHASESVENIYLNFTDISNVYNITNTLGNTGFVSELNQGSNYLTLFIPDLGVGQNSTFSYNINVTNLTSPINFTTNYSEFSVFAGSNFTVNDNLVNDLNQSLYTDTCIYNISIVQSALTIDQTFPVNFEFSGPITGSDSSNASLSGDNRTLTWGVLNNNCLNSTNTTDISYSIKTPVGVETADDYDFTNALIQYQFNDTFSRLELTNILASSDLELNFQKYQQETLTGDNATWKITSNVSSDSELLVTLDKVTLWVSQRNGTGTGFTNPSLRDNDTISGAELYKEYNPAQNLNSTLPAWNNVADEWFFNYTYSSSPIVWMDLENTLVDDGIQLTNRSLSYAGNQVYIKEIHVATGYWLEIEKNITRIADGEFEVFIKVTNLGSSVTPSNQAVVVYNFIPNTFNLTTPFVFSSSTWYNTDSTNTTLNDPTYNGTMHQYALLANTNPYNSSLDLFGGSENANNTWTVRYNVSGTGEFRFDDLFLTGVDPLSVGEVGGTQAITTQSKYTSQSSSLGYVLGTVASILAVLVLLI